MGPAAAVGQGETLSAVDVGVVELAEQVVDATDTDAARERLLTLGLSIEEIMDGCSRRGGKVLLLKTLDALAVLPDASYAETEPELRDLLVVGRPIAELEA